MILEGNRCSVARNLALHLMKPENEHIEVLFKSRHLIGLILLG
jgi:hypothetical protein